MQSHVHASKNSLSLSHWHGYVGAVAGGGLVGDNLEVIFSETSWERQCGGLVCYLRARAVWISS